VSVSKGKRFRVFQRDDFACVYCGRSAPDVTLECDHRQPRSRGGSDKIDNLVTACFDCNRGKRDRVLVERQVGVPVVVERIVEKTFPCIDHCAHCRDAGQTGGARYYSPYHEEPRGDGYVGSYRCILGHEWTTWWGASMRMTARELYEERMDDFVKHMCPGVDFSGIG
jgi:hypothetical protein